MAEELGEAFRVVPDQDFIADNDGRRRQTFVFLRQLPDDGESGVDAALFELHTAMHKEVFDPGAWRTVLLCKDNDFRLQHLVCQSFAVLGA